MKYRILHAAIVLVALAALLCCQGCTIKFKGTDFELDARSTVVYKFDGIELDYGESR